MTQDTPQRGTPTAAGWVPWGSRRRMLLLGVAGPVLSLIVAALGVVLLVMGHGGIALIVVGAVLLVFWLIALPLARRRQKI